MLFRSEEPGWPEQTRPRESRPNPRWRQKSECLGRVHRDYLLTDPRFRVCLKKGTPLERSVIEFLAFEISPHSKGNSSLEIDVSSRTEPGLKPFGPIAEEYPTCFIDNYGSWEFGEKNCSERDTLTMVRLRLCRFSLISTVSSIGFVAEAR